MRRYALAAVILALVAGCGDDDGGDDGVVSLEDTEQATAGTPAVDAERSLLEFAVCMRDQGLDWPDPSVDSDGNAQIELPEGFEPADLEGIFEAAEACQGFLEGIPLAFDSTDLTAVTDLLLDFAICMRANGFDLPDPDFSLVLGDPDDAPPAGPFGDVDLADPDFLAAYERCDDIVGQLGSVGN